jgi:hypothetical protein
MPTVPWRAIEANPEVYVDPNVLLGNTPLRSPADMEVHEVWTWITHIQRLQQGPTSFSFRPRDDIVRRLDAQPDLGPTG